MQFNRLKLWSNSGKCFQISNRCSTFCVRNDPLLFKSSCFPQTARFFALANYSAISKTARDHRIRLHIEFHLLRYFEAFTCKHHLKSGLGLAANILEYGVEHIWQFAECLIPFFRCICFITVRKTDGVQWIAWCCWLRMKGCVRNAEKLKEES